MGRSLFLLNIEQLSPAKEPRGNPLPTQKPIFRLRLFLFFLSPSFTQRVNPIYPKEKRKVEQSSASSIKSGGPM